jgi:mRNA-degrading endonuclease toxin of MazEF toxin-antitoxin module
VGSDGEHPLVTPLAERHAVVSNVVRVPDSDLELPLFEASEEEMHEVGASIADTLLLPELCANPPRVSSAEPAGDYPRWGAIYYAEPPLGGQTKRWLVVSHNYFNATTGQAMCVRTTSDTSTQCDEMPFIQAGFAVAACVDLMTKAAGRFDLESRAQLDQLQPGEMTHVARAITNFLSLHRQAGLIS